MTDDPAAAEQAAAIAEGSVAAAVRMLDPELLEFRNELMQSLAQTVFQPAAIVKLVQTFVDGAGKESAAKKQRLKDALQGAVSFFRQLMMAASGAAEPTNALRAWQSGAEAAAMGADLSLEAIAAVEANAAAANVLEWWADELATLQRTGTATLLSH